ncbi:uncharacterized protein LOC142598002 [Dermatophagoides farinae]|uniref:uncharacterized protein LOC142598002 n=1 Tax=Dermatophagoides farinae TaxID=6954 RepID=UPI003F5D78C8
MIVLLTTSLGRLYVRLFDVACPEISKNFLELIKSGYYTGSSFVFVKKDYIAELGDHNSSSALSHNSVFKDKKLFDEETIIKYLQGASSSDEKPASVYKHDKMGLLSTGGTSENKTKTNFLITLTNEDLTNLDAHHVVFGEYFVPLKEVKIVSAEVMSDQSKKGNIRLLEKLEEVQSKSRINLLTKLKDIQPGNETPDDRTLFVCRLNPVTETEDLQLIFSKYGEVEYVNLIKDPETNESLQYAFIKYVSKKDCEYAFEQLQNAIIDNRQIVVRFSQSVRKSRKNSKNRINSFIEKLE